MVYKQICYQIEWYRLSMVCYELKGNYGLNGERFYYFEIEKNIKQGESYITHNELVYGESTQTV